MSYRIAFGVAMIAGLVGGAAVHRAGLKAQSATTPSIVGEWSLNKDLSDQGQEKAQDGSEQGDRQRGRRGGGGFGGGRGGRGGFGGRGNGGGAAVDPEQAARTREALRDITTAPERLTIVQADQLIILTAQDGRTTRLSPDGKKFKDESTKIERKTKWDGSKLVTEITGLQNMKITEAYYIDPERHQLHVTLQSDNSRRPLMLHRVYDAENR